MSWLSKKPKKRLDVFLYIMSITSIHRSIHRSMLGATEHRAILGKNESFSKKINGFLKKNKKCKSNLWKTPKKCKIWFNSIQMNS